MAYYWKLSKSNINELKKRFNTFVDECEWYIKHLYNLDKADADYDKSRIDKDYFYMSPSEKAARIRRRYDNIVDTHNRRMNTLNGMIETFNFFIEVVEFTQFTSDDYGYHIKFKFYEGVVERVKDPTVPANRFRVSFSGAHWKFNDFNNFKFSAESVNIEFDCFSR